MTDTPKEKPDLSEMFDLTRHKAVRGYTDRFETLLRQRDGDKDSPTCRNLSAPLSALNYAELTLSFRAT